MVSEELRSQNMRALQIAPATLQRVEKQRPIGILMFGDSVDSKLVSYYCWLAAANVRTPLNDLPALQTQWDPSQLGLC